MSNQDPNDFLMGGGGAPSISWKDVPIGTTHKGVITDLQVRQQLDFATKKPKFWDDGNAMMQLEVTIQTDQRDASVDNDDGQRRLFVKGQMLQVVRDAVKKAGAEGLRKGGTIVVRFTATQPSGKGNDQKLFEAAYKAPEGSDVDAMLGASSSASALAAPAADLASVL